MKDYLRKAKLIKFLLPGAFLLILLTFSFTGYTNAWFTDSHKDSNVFTTGTLSIDVAGSDSGITGLFDLDNCTTLNYSITSEGSKRLYTRAWFNGFWQQTYHKNTATVTAYYNGEPYKSSDSAYYLYSHDTPSEFPGGMPPEPSYGFNDYVKLPPLVFPELQLLAYEPVQSSMDQIIPVDEMAFIKSEIVLENLTYSNNLSSSHLGNAILLNSEVNGEEEVDQEKNSGDAGNIPGDGSSSNLEEYPEGEGSSGDDTGSDDDLNSDEETTLDEMMIMAASYEPTGLGIIPELLSYTPEWGISLDSPSPCGDLKAFKIDFNPSSGVYKTGDAGTSTSDSGTAFSVTIERDGSKLNFSNASHPVIYAWVKGGPDGMLYSYYDLGGTTADTGLYPPLQSSGGYYGLSHITFIYCMPPEMPSITLKKYVSVDGGAAWHDADTLAEAPTLLEGPPQFKFVIENTGNVTLENILVEDDKFGQIGSLITLLEPGETETLYYTDNDWLNVDHLSTDNVQISICDSADPHWTPAGPQKLGTYFYYEEIIYPAGSGAYQVPLCINVCLNENLTGLEYDGAQFILYAAFDAVQVTNGMTELNWGISFPAD